MGRDGRESQRVFTMTRILLIFSVLLTGLSASSYDSTWSKSDYWSGEYPPGFEVYKKGVTVLGRTSLNENEKPSVSCLLKRNKYAPGKSLPKADYVEMNKIVPMIATEDFVYKSGVYDPTTETMKDLLIPVQKGDLVEYVANYSEGAFKARHNGIEFDANQDLFDHVDYEKDENGYMINQTHLWVSLSCVNNVSVWLQLSDLQTDPQNDIWIDGVRHYFHNPY